MAHPVVKQYQLAVSAIILIVLKLDMKFFTLKGEAPKITLVLGTASAFCLIAFTIFFVLASFTSFRWSKSYHRLIIGKVNNFIKHDTEKEKMNLLE